MNAERRRAVGIDLSKTELVNVGDFSTADPEELGRDAGRGHWSTQ